ncbi:Receptor-type guanylate cyclase gcy [Seminavis robusta]|uniref:Receptor-type guanylate cyclase gcy n=1 Tax=Seminavis robusta TaxID=568900 RepID=A0A9N8HS80_9STRA|nr:Receptor-type guanylate cyclase gcy [Seminavis robusta]|eukprot:Sro1408_g270090.1 Receptor-type guanylate cyclase gcy (1262) ;mRNA; r:13562-19097
MHRPTNQNTVRIADPEQQQPPRPSAARPREDDDDSISSGSSSSTSISKQFVEDSTSETGVSSSKRSMSTGETTGVNWFDDNMNASRSSSMVLGLVLLSAIILGTVLFVVASKQDDDKFHNKFHDASDEIFQVVHERSDSFANSLHRLSLTITDGAANAEAEWPFYTMKNLGVFAQDLLEDDPATLLNYAPLVSQENRLNWEEYSVQNQALVTGESVPEDPHLPVPPRPNISESIFRYVKDTPVDELQFSMGPFSPVWQVAPVPTGYNISVVNLNLLSHRAFVRLADATYLTRTSVVSELEEPQELLGIPMYPKRRYQIGAKGNPQRLMVQPIFEGFHEDSNIVGYLTGTQSWRSILSGIINGGNSDDKVELNCVVADSCTGRSYTYWINGSHTLFKGTGSLHDTKYEDMKAHSVLASYALHLNVSEGGDEVVDSCIVDLSIYPTSQMNSSFDSDTPVGYLILILFLAVVLIMAFTTHNKAVDQRQLELQVKTQRSNAIIASLFPEQIRDKLFGQDGEVKEEGLGMINSGAQKSIDSLLKTTDKQSGIGVLGFDDDSFLQKQIADLFPNCTVLFADICGFTAWSSQRDPSAVFNLLETVFRSFDEIARRRRVFKVETIGDCYLAVTGLPDPRRDHAIIMARFARDCLEKFHEVTRMLEVTLGPDTGDLGLRVGVHSGPVTAGVLRGERGRFQLFGDTVNTGSRLETTGARNRIQISKETAELVRQSGKATWVKPRTDLVTCKGKGALETFWLLPKSAARSSVVTGSTNSNSHVSSSVVTGDGGTERRGSFGESMPFSRQEQTEAKLDRLIFWVSESLLQSLRHIVARRNASAKKPAHRGAARESVKELEQEMGMNKVMLDEVREVITMPRFDPEAYANQVDPKTINLGQKVETQLREYVQVVASLYQSNPFHNFHHASHVTMSILKLLSRIVAPDNVLSNADPEKGTVDEDLHDFTYGITSDPLTQFAVLFSAVIHDVDHRGVSNKDLCLENKILATIFHKKSVAEQNSIDLAWQALMDPNFQDLRDCIYTDATELRRFRQLVVNCVLATDIFDKELAALRKNRWDKAFEISDHDATQEDTHRKATIVIEHLIQASDVSHTMQHWQVYIKWNEHFFEEQYTAFLQGRNTGEDPSKGWYKGEIWFFDNYIIPLAKKLKNCGVFGVSSDEYLNYALMNREEWEKRGQEVVGRFVEKYGKKLEKQQPNDSDSIATTAVMSDRSERSQQKTASTSSSSSAADQKLPLSQAHNKASMSPNITAPLAA